MLALLLASAIALLAGVQAQTAIEPEYNSAAYTVAISDAPARVDLPGLVNLTTGDDRVDYAPIGFQFVFFNRTFTSVNISSNGNLQFQTQVTGSANAFFGVSSTYSPAVAVFHTDLNPRNADSRQYATTGTAPNRQFIVRYNNVPYYSAGVNDTTLICDVVLYEGSNNIDMRWYNVPLRPTSINRNVEIGIQDVAQNLGANHLADWVALWNDRNFSAPETAALFNGKQARFTPLNSVPAGTPPPPTICTGTPVYGSRAYEIVVGNVPAMPQIPNAVNITSGDDRIDYTVLPFPFTFYGRTYNSVNVSTNGNAQFLTSETGSSGSFFLAMGTNPTYAPAIALFHADLNPNFVDARIYGTIGTAPNRQFIVRFNNVRYYGVTSGTGLIADMIFEEGTNNVVLNYYNVPVGTRAVEIGIQNSGNQSDWLAYWNDVAFSALCAESLNGKSLRFVPAGGVVPPPPSSSTGSVITPSSSTGAARSSSSSSVPVVTPSSSTGSQPTIPPVTPSSSSVRGPSSSSGPVVFSSTAVPAPSSTGSVLPIPDGSAQVAMNIQLREPVTASNFLQTAANLERDFASNVAEVTGGDVDGIAQHVRCTNIGGLARPAARRLLQNNTPVTFVVLPSISQAVNMNNPADAVQAVTNTIQTRVQNGDFETPNSGATVPAQTVTVTPVESNPDDGPNGSASVSALLALVVVAISMVLAL